MKKAGEYITDPSVLREARRANWLFDSAQDKAAVALQLAALMTIEHPETALGITPFAQAIADIGAKQANQFNKLTGETVYVKPRDVSEARAVVEDALKRVHNT